MCSIMNSIMYNIPILSKKPITSLFDSIFSIQIYTISSKYFLFFNIKIFWRYIIKLIKPRVTLFLELLYVLYPKNDERSDI